MTEVAAQPETPPKANGLKKSINENSSFGFEAIFNNLYFYKILFLFIK